MGNSHSLGVVRSCRIYIIKSLLSQRVLGTVLLWGILPQDIIEFPNIDTLHSTTEAWGCMRQAHDYEGIILALCLNNSTSAFRRRLEILQAVTRTKKGCCPKTSDKSITLLTHQNPKSSTPNPKTLNNRSGSKLLGVRGPTQAMEAPSDPNQGFALFSGSRYLNNQYLRAPCASQPVRIRTPLWAAWRVNYSS